MATELKEVNGEKRVALAIVTSSSGLDRVCCALRVSLENGPPHYPDNALLDGTQHLSVSTSLPYFNIQWNCPRLENV